MSETGSGPWAFVGDLHGRVSVLERILSRDRELKYHYVFLGDIIHHKPFFKYSKRVSPVKMLKMVSDLVDSGNATLVLGNNENYILRNLILPVEEMKKKEVKYTLKSLKEIDLSERLKYVSLLSNAPLSLELDDKYRLAHAYYPHATQTVRRDTVLHGPGYIWFRDNDLSVHGINPRYRYFFGHYGYPYWRQNISIIDATSLEAAGVYYTDRDEFMVYY
jgi:predicted phosphodiesterase